MSTTLSERFGNLTCEQRLFWLQIVGADEGNGRNARIAIDTWERSHGMTRERAAMEFMSWLILARESLGVEGYGHA